MDSGDVVAVVGVGEEGEVIVKVHVSERIAVEESSQQVEQGERR